MIRGLSILATFSLFNILVSAQDVKGLPSMKVRETVKILSAMCPAPSDKAAEDLAKIGFEQAWKKVLGSSIELASLKSGEASVTISFKENEKKEALLELKVSGGPKGASTTNLTYAEAKDKLEGALQIYYGFEPQTFSDSKIKLLEKVDAGACQDQANSSFSRATPAKVQGFASTMPFKLTRTASGSKDSVNIGESLAYLLYKSGDARKAFDLDESNKNVCIFQKDNSPSAQYPSKKLSAPINPENEPFKSQLEKIFKTLDYVKDLQSKG